MTRRTLFGGLAGLLPWRWFGRNRPTFELTIEPKGPIAITTVNDTAFSHSTQVTINRKPAMVEVIVIKSHRTFTIRSTQDIFPDLTRWLQANPDVWVSRYTEPPKEAKKP